MRLQPPPGWVQLELPSLADELDLAEGRTLIRYEGTADGFQRSRRATSKKREQLERARAAKARKFLHPDLVP